MLGENLSEGQRVYISGHLQSNSFFVTGNRQRQSFQIAASEVFVTKLDQTQVAETELSSEDGEIQTSNQSIDLNSVSIMSFVASEVEHFETSSTFALCSHHVRKYAMNIQKYLAIKHILQHSYFVLQESN